MLRLTCAALLVGLTGCTLWFDNDDDDDDCAYPAFVGDGQNDIAPAPLRDPYDLTCDSYGGYPMCDERCGPCPEYAADLAPLPSYNYCGHFCESLGESDCAANAECRVAKFAECVVGDTPCLTDFLGCFPVDTQPDVSVSCNNADAWDCSRNSSCSALYLPEEPCGTDEQCAQPFAMCIVEGTDPGRCVDDSEVLCDRIPPSCPSGTTPGVANGCYTDACIPNELCN